MPNASTPDDLTALRDRLRAVMVIPAHPLALDAARRLDERRQRALSRYYLAAGAGGLAVGVHTTQFEIHDPHVGLYRPVLELAAEEVARFRAPGAPAPLLIAGIVGDTAQAVAEAALARDLGYQCGLLSLAALTRASEDELVAHARAVADVLPVFGFYLQPAVGGRELRYSFWRRLSEIERLVGIKIAPFDRYRTLDVVRAVADSGRGSGIALYTGNDDNIILDLLTTFPFAGLRIVGGLLGQWAVWTHAAVALLDEIQALLANGGPIPPDFLLRNAELTDANAAVFDAHNRFAGCIPGIHEILRRQGLLEGTWTLNPREELSPGQREELDRVCAMYPHLTDDAFVAEHLDEWLA